jgi:hypothetical protein
MTSAARPNIGFCLFLHFFSDNFSSIFADFRRAALAINCFQQLIRNIVKSKFVDLTPFSIR